MLSKMNSAFFYTILLLFSQSKATTKSLNYTTVVLYNEQGKKITYGYVHLLSNDLIVNDISLPEWEREEKKGLNKIPCSGYLRIAKSSIKMNNKIDLDSINIVYRCDEGFGVQYKIPITQDTIQIFNVRVCNKQ